MRGPTARGEAEAEAETSINRHRAQLPLKAWVSRPTHPPIRWTRAVRASALRRAEKVGVHVCMCVHQDPGLDPDLDPLSGTWFWDPELDPLPGTWIRS